IAVLHEDRFWAQVNTLGQIPETLRDRLQHYFETYKLTPGGEAHVKVLEMYGPERAKEVVQAAQADYDEMFGE
ncbi:MAG TPA: inorganic diphosphatase, partial [Tichowtungia sp.]|nr:inorganic diphosphatase [Tichowtungia sp.]